MPIVEDNRVSMSDGEEEEEVRREKRTRRRGRRRQGKNKGGAKSNKNKYQDPFDHPPKQAGRRLPVAEPAPTFRETQFR